MDADQQVLGRTVTAMMDQIEAEHEGACVSAAVVIVAVPTDGGTAVRCRAETEDAINALGMLEIAKATIIANTGEEIR